MTARVRPNSGGFPIGYHSCSHTTKHETGCIHFKVVLGIDPSECQVCTKWASDHYGHMLRVDHPACGWFTPEAQKL